MNRNLIQFFFLLAARALDLLGLLVIAPVMFQFFGSEFRVSVEFFAIATFSLLLCKLGFEGLLIKNIKLQPEDVPTLILKVFTAKLILACMFLPLACLYYKFIEGDLRPIVVIILIIPLFLGEVINTSQITLIFCNTIWILVINLIKIINIFIGVWLAISFDNILYFMYFFSISHMITSIFHLVLNHSRVFLIFNFHIKDVFHTFYNSLYLFSIKIFTVLSDKVILILCLPLLSDYNAIVLDISIRFLSVATIPALLLYNFLRSRDIFVNKIYVFLSFIFLSLGLGVLYYYFLDFFGYKRLGTEANYYFLLSVVIGLCIFLSQVMAYISEYVALGVMSTGSRILNICAFTFPIVLTMLTAKDSLFVCFIMLSMFYIIGILVYKLNNKRGGAWVF